MSVTCKSHLTSGVSVHPENTVTHSAGNVHVGEKFVGLSLELLPSKVMAYLLTYGILQRYCSTRGAEGSAL